VFHLCPMFGGSLVGKTLLGPVSGSFQGTLVSFTETLGFVVGLVQTRFYGADSAKLGKGKILQRYRNVIVHPPCCCVYFNQTLGNRHSSRLAALLGSVGKPEAGSHIDWANCGRRRIDETTITGPSKALNSKPY